MVVFGWVLLGLLTLYEWVLITRAVISWVRMLNPSWVPRGVMLVVAEGAYTLTDPPLRFLRKLIRPLRIGGTSLDMAFFVLFCLILLCAQAVQRLFLW